MRGPERAGSFCERYFRPKLDGNPHPHHGWALFKHLLLSAVFVAGLVHLMQPVLVPLDVAARIVAVNLTTQAFPGLARLAAPEAETAPELAILKIDPALYRRASAPTPDDTTGGYGASSPLNRCRLKTDVDAILAAFKHLKVLGFDFDLTPVHDPTQQACAQALFKTLQAAHSARGLTVIAILPVSREDREASLDWRKTLSAHGILLAENEVEVQLGAIREHVVEPGRCPTLGRALARPVEQAAAQPYCLRDDAPLSEGDKKLKVQHYGIAFQRWAQLDTVPRGGVDGRVERLDEQIARMSRHDSIRKVLLGPGYDRTDEYDTPVGPMHGVDIHGAVALDPAERHWKWLDFALDIVLGLGFGALVHHFWQHYFDQRLGLKPELGHPLLAWRWLGWMLVWLLGAVVLVLMLSTLLISWLWINAAPMAFGMVLDALVFGSVAVAVGLKPVLYEQRATGLQRLFAHVPAALWLGLLLYTLHAIHTH